MALVQEVAELDTTERLSTHKNKKNYLYMFLINSWLYIKHKNISEDILPFQDM